MIKIAFLDDGINPEFVPDGVPFNSYAADENGLHPCEPESRVSHGTMCYQIFSNTITTPYSLLSVKVLDNATGTGNHKALVTALKWCATQDIDIINLSMGTRQYMDFSPIASAVQMLSKTVIVAACSNQNVLTFPACMPTVIGVRHCDRPELIGNFTYLHNPYDQINVMTCVKDIPISFGGGCIDTLSGSNSFAAPLISARVCGYLSQGVAPQAVCERLKIDSVCNAGFADYDFYKNLYVKWEEVEIPIVAVPGDFVCEADRAEIFAKLKLLIAEFVKDGYRALCLLANHETSIVDFMYSLESTIPTRELIGLYYNFALPDIIFLQMRLEDIMLLPKELQADVVIKAGGQIIERDYLEGKYIFDLDAPHQKLFPRIVELLG